MHNPHIENQYAPLVPGEDFLNNKPSGFNKIDFPFNLIAMAGDSTAVFITLEPDPDPFPREPFPLVVLSRNLPFKESPDDLGVKIQRIVKMGNRQKDMPRIEVTRADPVN
jgi:hypothetical protein